MLLDKFGTNVPFYFRPETCNDSQSSWWTNNTCCHDTAETQRFENI